MALISPAVLDEIRLRSDIATVIGSYFHVQRAGSTFKALCPFHKEKTPSFNINPQKQIFHCFGCGMGGDVFRFIMEYEKVDFMTAVRMLAKKAGVALEMDAAAAQGGISKEAMFDVNVAVARLYHEHFMKSPEAEDARRYLAKRQISLAVAKEFLIGFAPNRWGALTRWGGKKYGAELMLKVGLIGLAEPREGEPTTNGERYYDRFRNRLMFPIHDEQGRVAGFSGRIMADDVKTAKYVNTSDTPLFHKGRILYALHKARKPMVESRTALICEGQIDVIRCHMAGFTTAVAAQGTAFTDDHARLIKRYADSVILMFDADSAGQKAACRAAETFLHMGLVVQVATLPQGEDPDSLLLKPDGPAQFKQLLDTAQQAVDFQIAYFKAQEPTMGEAGLLRITKAVIEVASGLTNAVQQAGYVARAAQKLGIAETALRAELQHSQSRGRTPMSAPPTRNPPAETGRGDAVRPIKEWALVEHVLADSAHAVWVKKYLPLDLITDPECRKLLDACLRAAETSRDVLSVLRERYPEDMAIQQKATECLATPSKIKSEFATVEESIQLLIIGIRSMALQRRRKEIERQKENAALSAADRKNLEIEYGRLGYDMARLKTWESAAPILEYL